MRYLRDLCAVLEDMNALVRKDEHVGVVYAELKRAHRDTARCRSRKLGHIAQTGTTTHTALREDGDVGGLLERRIILVQIDTAPNQRVRFACAEVGLDEDQTRHQYLTEIRLKSSII